MTIVEALQRPFRQTLPLQAEGNAAINKAKAETKDLGAMVMLSLRHDGKKPLSVAEVRWNREGLAEHAAAYDLIWWRTQPDPMPPNREAILSLCLRQRLRAETKITVRLDDGQEATIVLRPEAPALHIEALTFEPSLHRAWIYAAIPAGDDPTSLTIHVDGKLMNADACRWYPLPRGTGMILGRLTFPESLSRGSVHVFRLGDGREGDIAALRAFSRWSVFGTYGSADFERLAFNGLNGYNSFGKLQRPALDEAASLGIRCAIMTGPKPPDTGADHAGLYAYVLTDEPDCKDYAAKDRPMNRRIGAHAPQMLEFAAACRRKDPSTPTMLTLDLTFTPANYFVYGRIADVANPDCYPVTLGWPIRIVRNYLDTVRRACAPCPFVYTYQGSWEEYAKKSKRRYVGGAELRTKGWDAFRDPDKVRGFGRPPHPDEVAITMLYGLGCGAKGLFSYIDSSELSGTVMFHGSEDLPEIWDMVGRMSRRFRCVAPLLDISSPVSLASTRRKNIWVRTLLCGDQAALVIAVNENFSCDKHGFRVQATPEVSFDLPLLSRASSWQISRVDDTTPTVLESRADHGVLTWKDTLRTGALYLASSAAVRTGLVERYRRLESSTATAIVVRRRAMLKAERDRRMLVADLLDQPPESRLVGQAVNGYGVTDKAFWNPNRETYNGIDFWERKGTKILGVQWSCSIRPEQVGIPLRFFWQGRLYGGAVAWRVRTAEGMVLAEAVVADAGTLTIREHALVFPEPGTYVISVTVRPQEAREHGGRIGRVAFLLPASPNPPSRSKATRE